MSDSARDRRQTIELAGLNLSPGEGKRADVSVIPDAPTVGGVELAVGDGPVAARLDVSRTAAGFALRLRFEGEVRGPCFRCLEPAAMTVPVDAREVDQPLSRDEDLLSPYVDEGDLDLGAWARDALTLALPAKILCRPDCAGLCPVCGESRNDAAPGAHDHPKEPDPRWAKLRELQ